jgi:4-hydroxy-3-methylbut-2-enyl diphosphate reductase
VKKLTLACDLILVVGSQNSSNSNRLMEISQKKGVPAYLIDDASEIQEEWLENKKSIGVTAGASAPEILVEEVIKRIKGLTDAKVINNAPGIKETVVFSLPRELVKETNARNA